jgi:predicted Rossmann fold flavoprotein
MPRVIVIGAGAAGSMAAIFAARGGAETILLEGSTDGGRKILISGGGRCNILPMVVDEARYITDSSPNLLRKMLRAWPVAEQRAFFEEDLAIPLAEEHESNKLFPVSNKARDVRDGLLAAAKRAGAQVLHDRRVVAIAPDGEAWRVNLANGESLSCDRLILATGGLSVPATGSDGAGLTMLGHLGYELHERYAALTPITAAPSTYTELSGLSLTVTITARSAARSSKATGGFLFTHRGYSGPSVLNVSHVVVRARAAGIPATLTVQWTPLVDADWEARLRPQGVRTVAGAVRAELPDRLAAVLIAAAAVDPTRLLSELRREERLRLIDTLVRGDLPWNGDEGYKKAEVTGGGVALSELQPRTLESRRHPGLFLCGEVLDAFGPIGGYNFLWAWSTGRAAGIGAAAPLAAP